MGKKHSLTTDQKKKKEDYNLLSPSKKKSYFPKIFLFLLNLHKKTFPVLYKKEKKKRKWISFKKKSLFLFKFFSPQKKTYHSFFFS